jgi:hypothetical protein
MKAVIANGLVVNAILHYSAYRRYVVVGHDKSVDKKRKKTVL